MIEFDLNALLLDERIWGRVVQEDDCWIWTGATSNGYGLVGRKGAPTRVLHRLIYLAMVGEIPPGLELDHLCETPPCINPYHQDPVTPAVNCQRRNSMTECPQGHAYDEENTLRYRGARFCRACHKTRQQERRAA